MSSYLVEDCLRIIFTELQNNPNTLYSCILVNRFWCRMTIPILWKNPPHILTTYQNKNKLFNIIFNFLPMTSKQYLFDNNIKLPLLTFTKPLFNYISFFSQISPDFIDDMIKSLVKKELEFDKYKKLEQVIYKLFINNCKDIKHFYWQTTQPLHQYSGSSTCFSQLCTLNIDLEFVNSTALSGMTQICQNIEELKIVCHDDDVSGLIMLIEIQKNLRSLFLYFKGFQKQSIRLSEVIERKSDTLKKFTIKPNIALLSPKFLPSLINLQHLDLKNRYEMEAGNVEMKEWEKYLSMVTFPNLQYLKTLFLPICNDYLLIEKSQGNITEINIYRRYEDRHPLYTENLIKAISRYCPKIERLTIDAELENLNGIREILLNCSKLKMINLSTYNKKQLRCDELLEILSKFSPNTLHNFSFSDNWNFSTNSLKTFFESWRNRFPIIFNLYFGLRRYFTKNHDMIVKKYFDEGIIKETNCNI